MKRLLITSLMYVSIYFTNCFSAELGDDGYQRESRRNPATTVNRVNNDESFDTSIQANFTNDFVWGVTLYATSYALDGVLLPTGSFELMRLVFTTANAVISVKNLCTKQSPSLKETGKYTVFSQVVNIAHTLVSKPKSLIGLSGNLLAMTINQAYNKKLQQESIQAKPAQE